MRTQRDPVWTESLAVGEEMYVLNIKRDLSARGIKKHAVDNGSKWVLQDAGIP